MKPGDKLYDLVYQLLIDAPELRGSDKMLMWRIWGRLGYLTIDGRYGTVLTSESLYNKDCPTPESITRCRRKIQELHPEVQAANRTRRARADKAAEKGTHIFRERAKQKPQYCPQCLLGTLREQPKGHYEGTTFVFECAVRKCSRCDYERVV